MVANAVRVRVSESESENVGNNFISKQEPASDM